MKNVVRGRYGTIHESEESAFAWNKRLYDSIESQFQKLGKVEIRVTRKAREEYDGRRD
jgi:hypothetical protein